MAKQPKKSEAAKRRPRGPNGSFLPTVTKNAMPREGDNSRFSDHLEGNVWIANPHDRFTDAAPPGITPIAPGVYSANAFRMLTMTPNQVFRNLDAALAANRISAKAMLADGAITSPLFQRVLHLVSCNDGLVPEDENDPEQIETCAELWKRITDRIDWPEFKRTLNFNGMWYGKTINLMDYRWDYINGQRAMIPMSFESIIGDKLVFRNNGEMGYIVHIPSGFRDVVVTDIGRAELFNDSDYESIVHHKYFTVDMPYDEGYFAIGQQGYGYRHYLYYVWYLKQKTLEWLMLGLQIFGSGGLRIAYFEEGNEQSMKAVAEAMRVTTNEAVILFPRPIGTGAGAEKAGAGLEVVAPQGMGLEWFTEILNNYFGKQIKELFLGQDYESERKDLFAYLRYDGQKLSTTITNQLVKPMLKYNFPGYKHQIRYEISVPHPNSESVMTAAQRLFELGAPIGAREVATLCGLTVPTKGCRILQKSPAEMQAGMANNAGGEDQTIKKPRIGTGNLESQLTGGTGVEHSIEARRHEKEADQREAAAV